MRMLLNLLVAALIGAALAFAALNFSSRSKSEVAPPEVQVLQRMGHLVSLRVNVSDIIEFTQDRTFGIPWTSWQFPYAGTKVILIARGDCLLATDMRKAKYESVDQAKRKLTIVLPRPTVLQARLNHDSPEHGGTRLYALSNQGIEALIPGGSNRTKAIEGAMKLGQQLIEQAGSSEDAVKTAKDAAEAVVKASYTALGWSADIRWLDTAKDR
jgi:hypothetical protein